MKALHTFTDKVLVDRVQAGDIDAYEILFKRYSGKIYRFVYFRIREQETVDDLVSETFLKLWQQLADEKKIKNLQAYLYRIARNIVIDHYRARKEDVDISAVEHVLEADIDLTHDVTIQSDIKEMMHKMNSLSDDYQEILQLRYVEDLTIAEIAQVLEKSKGAVKVSIHRAVKKLQEVYQDES